MTRNFLLGDTLMQVMPSVCSMAEDVNIKTATWEEVLREILGVV